MSFKPLVITNREFTKDARGYGQKNQVKMYERKELKRNLKQYPVTWQDVNRCQF